MTDNTLVYSTFLLHNPRPAGNLSILRTNRVEVPIECHYPRSVWPPLAQRPLGKHVSLLVAPGSEAVRTEERLGLSSLPSVLVGVGVALRPLLRAPETGRPTAASWGKLQGCPAPSVQKGSLGRGRGGVQALTLTITTCTL